MTPKAFDTSTIVAAAILSAAGAATGNPLYYLGTLEVVAVLFGIAYLMPHYSLLTEFSYSLVTVLFFPRTRHWLWILCFLITGMVFFEGARVSHATYSTVQQTELAHSR